MSNTPLVCCMVGLVVIIWEELMFNASNDKEFSYQQVFSFGMRHIN
jgi:hypothetical protein